MSFEDIPIIDPYFEYSPSDEIRLRAASSKDVDLLEFELKTSMPIGYREYVTTLGLGEYCNFIRIKLPFLVLDEYKEHQFFIKEHYYFWETGKDVLPKERAVECVEIGSTFAGDSIIFHPDDPNELFVLPRHDDMLYRIGNNLYEAIDWLLTRNGENHEKRHFVPWSEHIFRRPHKHVTVDEDWKPEINISREIFKVDLRAKTSTGPNYFYKLADTDFADLQVWKPEQSEPPLSIHQAVLIARKELPRFVENSENYEVMSISLNRFGENNWVYMVAFSFHNFDRENPINEHHQIFVKMDGQIIEPVAE